MQGDAFFITAQLKSDRCIFFGGAKAPTTELEGLRLQSIVRSLRTRDCKRTRSNFAMCTFAPPKKMQRFDFSCAVIRMAHHTSACVLNHCLYIRELFVLLLYHVGEARPCV